MWTFFYRCYKKNEYISRLFLPAVQSFHFSEDIKQVEKKNALIFSLHTSNIKKYSEKQKCKKKK